jgi:hypothetical protein
LIRIGQGHGMLNYRNWCVLSDLEHEFLDEILLKHLLHEKAKIKT